MIQNAPWLLHLQPHAQPEPLYLIQFLTKMKNVNRKLVANFLTISKMQSNKIIDQRQAWILMALIWTLKTSETSILKFSKLKQHKWKLWTWLTSGQWYLNFLFTNKPLMMLVWRVQSWDNLPQNWKSCSANEHSSRCCDDQNSSTEVPGSYCNT